MVTSANLAPQEYWDEAYSTSPLHPAHANDAVRQWIEQWVPNGSGECLEVGCFPGRYLPVLGAKGYRLSGIDLTPRVETDLPEWLCRTGFSVGTFKREDFLAHKQLTEYNVVCSFGFIEHFVDFAGVLQQQAKLVKRGGLLLVTAPNFSGLIQRLLHRVLDKENLLRHNLAAMNASSWVSAVADDGFTPIFYGPFGGIAFWVDRERRSLIRTAGVRVTTRFAEYLSRLRIPNCALYSPYIGMIAKRS